MHFRTWYGCYKMSLEQGRRDLTTMQWTNHSSKRCSKKQLDAHLLDIPVEQRFEIIACTTIRRHDLQQSFKTMYG